MKTLRKSVLIRRSLEKVRKKFGRSSEEIREKFGTTLNATQQKILLIIERNHQTKAVQIAEELSLSSRAVEKNIKELRDAGIIIHRGSTKNGYWEVISDEETETGNGQ